MIGNALELMVPILLASLGGLLTERAGVLNIGLEGLVLVGAFVGLAAANATGSLVGGLAGGAVAGMVLALLYSAVCLELRANIFVAGLAVNLLAAGFVPYLSSLFYGTRGVVRLVTAERLPDIAGVTVLLPFALVIAAVVWVLVTRTPFGIRLRASGSNPDALMAQGLSPDRYRRIAMIASGALAGLGGAEVSLRLGIYLPNISAGRGWIALVAVYLGARHPLGIVGAAALFALFESFAGAAQGFTQIPGTVLTGLPYLVTMIAMVVYSAVRRSSRGAPG